MNERSQLLAALEDHTELLEKTVAVHGMTLSSIARTMIDALRHKHKILIFGNGGSYADSLHFAAELEGAYKNRSRAPLDVLVPANPSTLTAISNDFGYSEVFSRFVNAHARPQDVVIGLSTSGNSPNVVAGLKAAKQIDAYTIGFTGQSGGDMRNYSNVLFNVPSIDTPRIQEIHMFAVHHICGVVEEELFGKEH